MPQRFVFMAAAWLEIVVGAVVLTLVAIPCLLLFVPKPEGIGMPIARFAGFALVALGIACLPSTATGPRHSAVLGLFSFNAGVATLFAWVAVDATLHGSLLWPVAVLHAVFAAALLAQLLTKRHSLL
jgi:hypothetical protein